MASTALFGVFFMGSAFGEVWREVLRDPWGRLADLPYLIGIVCVDLLGIDTSAAVAREALDHRRVGELLPSLSLRLDPATLARTGMHPELGRVTLAQLLASWVVHDLGHLAQILRVLAKRYGGEVGPWREYSPILER